MTDPALCGPVCLALPQDVQTQAFDCPEDFLHPGLIRFRRPPAEATELAAAAALLRGAKRPLIIAGGGVLYSQAWAALRSFAERHGIPVTETQAGKSSLPWDHPLNLGAVGVTGSPAANAMAVDADVVLAIGTRLQDFTTGSHALFPAARLISLNVNALDADKWGSFGLLADAQTGLAQLQQALTGWAASTDWTTRSHSESARWRARLLSLPGARRRQRSLPPLPGAASAKPRPGGGAVASCERSVRGARLHGEGAAGPRQQRESSRSRETNNKSTQAFTGTRQATATQRQIAYSSTSLAGHAIAAPAAHGHAAARTLPQTVWLHLC
jgi:hypothetical protein